MRDSWLLLVALAACGNSGTADKGSGPAADPAEATPARATGSDATPEPRMINPANVTWHEFAIDDLGISLDVFAGDGVDPPSVSEGYLTQRNGPAGISVTWGADVGIEAWKRTAGDLSGQTISPTTDVQLCGKSARIVTVNIPDRGTIRGKHHRKRMPARTLTMVELALGDLVALFSFFVETDAEAAYREALSHFLSSVKCP